MPDPRLPAFIRESRSIIRQAVRDLGVQAKLLEVRGDDGRIHATVKIWGDPAYRVHSASKFVCMEIEDAGFLILGRIAEVTIVRPGLPNKTGYQDLVA